MGYNRDVRIRVLSYNIHKGFDPFNRHFVLEEIRDLIRSSEADVVCLQEVVGDNEKLLDKGHTGRQAEYLADEIWSHYSYAKNSLYDHGHHGNLILSKFPILEFENIDLSTNDLESRGLLICKLLIPEVARELTVMTTHLNLLSSGRSLQYQRIRREMNKHGGEPVIFAGDFNDWNKRASVQFEGVLGFEEVHKKVHGGYARTFPSFSPILTLDRIYTKNLEIVDAMVFKVPSPLKLSDHLPLLAEVELL